MKNMTRVLALLLALILVLGLVVTGFADDGGTTGTGKITINNAVAGQTYTIYKILTLESYNAEAGKEAYSYKPASEAWKTFLTTGEGKDYVNITADNNADNVEAGYVTWKNITSETEVEKQARVAEFAKKALAYAKNTSNNIGATKTQENVTEGTVTFDGLPLGYYLLDSSLGTLCSLDTTKPEAAITEKNAVPENKKLVQEDSKVGTADEYGTKNDADIGQTVNFKSTITLPKGASNVKYHDTMDTNLELDANTIKVYTNEALSDELLAANYAVISVKNESDLTDGCTFEITFNQTYLNGLTADTTTVYVGYSAKVKNTAPISTALENKSHLTYGDKNTKSAESTTKTYTWGFIVEKHAQTENGKVLANAEFVLLNHDKTNVAVFTNGLFSSWATTTEQNSTWADNNKFKTGDDGKFEVKGLDAGTYYLKEIQAPAGYNKLKDPVEVKINPTQDDTTHTITLTPVTVKVVNQTGAEMPSTGGIGTTVFYVVGGILAVGAAVLLVTKKRMERG